MTKKIYRVIWEKHNGPIPVDEFGITYDIHHIDGNRNNNDIENLIAVSMAQHYEIHYAQGDVLAAKRIAERAALVIGNKLMTEEDRLIIKNGISHNMKVNNPSTRAAGDNHWCRGKVVVVDKDDNVFHTTKDDPRYLSGELVHINKGKITVKDQDDNVFHTTKDDPRYLSGELKHVSTGLKRNWTKEEVDERYSFRRGIKQTKETIEKRKETTKRNGKAAKHNIEILTCPHCGKIGKYYGMKAWHFDNCGKHRGRSNIVYIIDGEVVENLKDWVKVRGHSVSGIRNSIRDGRLYKGMVVERLF